MQKNYDLESRNESNVFDNKSLSVHERTTANSISTNKIVYKANPFTSSKKDAYPKSNLNKVHVPRVPLNNLLKNPVDTPPENNTRNSNSKTPTI